MSTKMLSRNYAKQIGQCLTVVRTLHQKTKPEEQPVTAVDIPMPWGKIAGKWWGSTDQQPILTLHGWQDNAASFDALIPMLPKNHSFLTIDMPGHGFSDWYPTGMPYSIPNAIMFITRIAQYYGWENVKLMGHSMGSIFNFLYASHFPKETKFVIAIDALKPSSGDVNKRCESVRKNLIDYLRIEQKNSEPPGYTEEEIMARWIKATENSLDEDACRSLMERGVGLRKDGKYFFNRDPKLRSGILEIGNSQEQHLQLAARIECPFMFLKADSSSFFENKKNVLDVVEVLRKSSSDFRFHTVIGKHHVHMTDAPSVSKLITPFIEKYNN